MRQKRKKVKKGKPNETKGIRRDLLFLKEELSRNLTKSKVFGEKGETG